MRHKVKLSVSEKIRAWLDLSDFSFRLMQAALSNKELETKLKQISLSHKNRNKLMLERMAKVK